MPTTPIPLAPDFVLGLINLRGQIVTAVSLRRLFGIAGDPVEDSINIVCDIDDMLIAFNVDAIGEVLEVLQEDYLETPSTVPKDLGRFMSGIYKLPDSLISIIDINCIHHYLNNNLS